MKLSRSVRSKSRFSSGFDRLFFWLFAFLAGIAILYFMLPILSLGIRAVQLYVSEGVITMQDVWVSLKLSITTTVVSIVVIFIFGTPLAYVFSRYTFPLKSILSVFVELPIVMPPIVAGLALLATFGRRGILGQALQIAGLSIPFTTLAVIMAQVFVSSPFYIRAVQSRFNVIPVELEEAAEMDGASPVQIFFSIIFPMSGQAILTGLLLSWARALGEFGATILFAGNLEGSTRTMPLLIFSALERDFGATYLTACLLLVLATFVFLIVRLLANLDDTKDRRRAH